MKQLLVFLAVSMMVVSLFAGCVDNGIGCVASNIHLEKALEVAKARISSPVLVAIAGVEPFKNYTYEDIEVIVYADDNIGDGKAPTWIFGFQGNGKAVAVVVLATGLVLAEIWDSNVSAGEQMKPIEECKYHSEDVAKLLSKDGRWPKTKQSDMVLWELSMNDGAPVWSVTVEELATYNTTVALVNAKNGTVISIKNNPHETVYQEDAAWSGADNQSQDRPHEGGFAASSASGWVTPLSGIGTEIMIENTGYVFVRASVGDGAGSARFTLERDGEVVAEYGFSIMDYEEFEFSSGGMAPGTYVASIDVQVTEAQAAVRYCEINIWGAW